MFKFCNPSTETDDIDKNIKIVEMTDADFEDENENRNEFEQLTFTTEWYEREKANFGAEHDKNGDGYLDLEEIIIWQHPEQYDSAAVEAKWLLENADLGIGYTHFFTIKLKKLTVGNLK